VEKTIEELQIDLRIAEAKIDLLFKYLGYLTDELNRSDVIEWNQNHLRRQFLGDFDYSSPGEEVARMELEVTDEDSIGVTMTKAMDEALAKTRRLHDLREEIAKQIRHGEA
jgi:hypothetical protein